MKISWRLTLVLVAVTVLASSALAPLLWKVQRVTGMVRSENGLPAGGAIVRVKTSAISTMTDANGRFKLSGFEPAFRVRVTSWKDGFYVAGADVRPWNTTVDFDLDSYAVPDNVAYSWVPPAVSSRSAPKDWLLQAGLGLGARISFENLFRPLSEHLTLGCRDCHGETIFDEWAGSAHALGTRNPRFMSMYNGVDLDGNKSSPTRRGHSREYGSFPLRPDPDQPYFGPGYKLDFPKTAGNCAACHLPSAATESLYRADPNQISGVDALGSHCDFCHKIAEVKLNPATRRPYENMPGVLSINLMRPGPDRQIFFGSYDDVDVGPDTYLPLMKESAICAPCHDASFWGVPIYQSYAEWLASPYSARGETCQSCHMRPNGVTTNFAPGRGGWVRDPQTIPTHDFPGAADTRLLQNAVTMTSRTERRGEHFFVTVTITNDKTGHHVPTDSPLRQMILVVQAVDAQGRRLPLIEGPIVPDWGGNGDPDEGHYAGLPGKGFAKILEELWTGVSPSGAYWNPTRIVEDSRLAAFAVDTSTYTFSVDEERDVTTDVRLFYRRAPIDLMQQKGWKTHDIVMARHVHLSGDQI